MATALVAGGAGFIGSHVCDRLLSDGWDVVCVDNLLTGQMKNLQHIDAGSRFLLVLADVTESLPQLPHVDLVMHLASPASPLDYPKMPLETMRVNSLGTERLLELARDQGARFLFASTSEAYGDPEVHPQPETYWGRVNPVGPRAIYDESKRYGEAMTAMYRRIFGVDTSIARVFNTYGPRTRIDDGRVVPEFIRRGLSGQAMTVHGDGSQTRSLVYVTDMAEGLVSLVMSDLPGPVNLGSQHEVTVLELAGLVAEAVGVDLDVEWHPRPVDDPSRRRADATVARDQLGWMPRVAFEDGIAATVDHIRRSLAK